MSLSPEGLEWREYFARMKSVRHNVEQVTDEYDEVLEIIEPSRPATPADLNSSVAGIIASAAVCGFWSASQVTRVFLPGKEFKTGERAGERRPDKELTNVFVYAAHEDGRHIEACWQEGKLLSAIIGVARGPERVVKKMGELEAFIEGR